MADEILDTVLRLNLQGIEQIRRMRAEQDKLDASTLRSIKSAANLDDQVRKLASSYHEVTAALKQLQRSGVDIPQIGKLVKDLEQAATKFRSIQRGGLLPSTTARTESQRLISTVQARQEAERYVEEVRKAQLRSVQRQGSGVPLPAAGSEFAKKIAEAVRGGRLREDFPKAAQDEQQRLLRVQISQFRELFQDITARLKENPRFRLQDIEARLTRGREQAGFFARKVTSPTADPARGPLGSQAIQLGQAADALKKTLQLLESAAKSPGSAAFANQRIFGRLSEQNARGIFGDQAFINIARDISASASGDPVAKARANLSAQAQDITISLGRHLISQGSRTLQVGPHGELQGKEARFRPGVDLGEESKINRQIDKVAQNLRKIGQDALADSLDKVLKSRQTAFRAVMKEKEEKLAQQRIEEERRALKESIQKVQRAIGPIDRERAAKDRERIRNALKQVTSGTIAPSGLAGLDPLIGVLGPLTREAGRFARRSAQEAQRVFGQVRGSFRRPTLRERFESGEIPEGGGERGDVARLEFERKEERRRLEEEQAGFRFIEKRDQAEEEFRKKSLSVRARISEIETEAAARSNDLAKKKQDLVEKEARIKEASVEKIGRIEGDLFQRIERYELQRQAAIRKREEAEKRVAEAVSRFNTKSGQEAVGGPARANRIVERLQREQEKARRDVASAEAKLAFASTPDLEEISKIRQRALERGAVIPGGQPALRRAQEQIEDAKKREERALADIQAKKNVFAEKEVADNERKNAAIAAQNAKLSAADEKQRRQTLAAEERLHAAVVKSDRDEKNARLALLKRLEAANQSTNQSTAQGLASLAFAASSAGIYLHTLRRLGQETITYAARTETLQLVTRQMAEVNQLNTDQVLAQVEAVKNLNITTQAANTTVQKMIFAQLDVAKATDLARLSQNAAVIANVNSSEALERVIRGITTGQSRVLFNLGLQVSLQQTVIELRRKLRAEGIEREPLEFEKRQAQFERVLQEGVKISGTYERSLLSAGKQMTSLRREIEETQNALGNHFLPLFGEAVALTTNFLQGVQEDSRGVADLTKAIISLGAALGAISALRIGHLLFAGAGGTAGLIAGGVGLAAFLGTNALLNRDPRVSIESQRDLNLERAKKRRREILEEQKRFTDSLREVDFATLSEEERHRLTQAGEQYEAQLSGNEAAQREIISQSIDQKAQLLIRERKEYEQHLREVRTFGGNLQRSLRLIFSDPGEFIAEAAGAPTAAGTLASIRALESDPLVKAREDQIEAQKKAIFTARSLINREIAERRRFFELLQVAQQEFLTVEEDLEKKRSDALLSFTGGQAERIKLDSQLQLREAKAALEEVRQLQQSQEPEDILTFQDRLLEIGRRAVDGGEFRPVSEIPPDRFREVVDAGRKVFDDLYKRWEDIVSENNRKIALQIGTLSKQAAAELNRARSGLEEQRILGLVDPEDLDAQKQAVQEVSQLRVKALQDEARLLGNNFDVSKSIALEEVRLAQELLTIDQQRTRAAQELANERRRALQAFDIEGRTTVGLGAGRGRQRAELLAQRFDLEVLAAQQEPPETRNRLVSEAGLRLLQSFRELSLTTKQEELDLTIRQIEAEKSLQEARDRAISDTAAPGRRELRDIQELERSRQRELVALERILDAQRSLNTEDEVNRDRRLRSLEIQTRFEADRIRIAKEGIEAVKQAQIELARVQLQRLTRIAELQTTNAAEEIFVARQVHEQKLRLIQREFEIRGGGEDALRQKTRDTAQANFELLETLLEARRREIEGVRNAAESVFDALVSGGETSIGDLIRGQIKVIGRQIFSNIAVEFFTGARGALGSIIPGQSDASGRPNLLGRILGGTVFSPSRVGDIQQRIAEVTEYNASATEELNETLLRLISILEGRGPISAAGGAVGQIGSSFGSIPLVGQGSRLAGGLLDVFSGGGGLFSGANRNNPLIFHAAGLGLSNVPLNASGISDKLGILTPGFPLGTSGGKSAFSKALPFGLGAGLGAFTAFSGFKRGGGAGISQGVSGTLGALSLIPGPQQPFLQAGALIAGFVSALFGDPRVKRQEEIDKFLEGSQFQEPDQISRVLDVKPGEVDFDLRGGPRPVNVNMTMNIQAFDSKSVLDHSFEIGEAVRKEIRLGNPSAKQIQETAFGV